jgi:hypothetical protein
MSALLESSDEDFFSEGMSSEVDSSCKPCFQMTEIPLNQSGWILLNIGDYKDTEICQ